MVAQNHHGLVAQVALQGGALVEVDGEALGVVISHLAVKQIGVLRQGQQAALEHGQGHARAGVRVQHTGRIGPGLVDGAVDHKAGLVHFVGRAIDFVAFQIDFDQAGGRDFIKGVAKGVEQKMLVVAAWHHRRDVGVNQIGPAKVRRQAVAGGQLHAGLPLLRADFVFHPIAGGQGTD